MGSKKTAISGAISPLIFPHAHASLPLDRAHTNETKHNDDPDSIVLDSSSDLRIVINVHSMFIWPL